MGVAYDRTGDSVTSGPSTTWHAVQGSMADNQHGKPRRRTTTPDPRAGEAGQLGKDDRGNVTWQWADDEELLADDDVGNTARILALVDPTLQLKDEAPGPDPAKHVNAKGLKSGYNPYNSGALVKDDWKKKKNLRELSKWIKLRKRVALKKDGE